MSKIAQVFKKGPAYVGFLVAGDGGLDYSLEAMQAMVAGGVDIIEVGMPFSDPVADGPTIQQAAMRALENNVTVDDVLALVQRFREHSDVPVIFFSYYNPVLAAMQNGFFKKAQAAGLDGCLLVDLPYEESAYYFQQCAAHHIDPILLMSPSTPLDRLKKLNQQAHGMLYYVCRKGTTGVKQALPDDFAERLAEIKSIASVPVVAGFGIADAATAQAVLQHADGFVVGSALVQAMAKAMPAAELTRFVASIDPR